MSLGTLKNITNSSLSFLRDWKSMCKQPSKYNPRDLMRDVWATYDEHLRFLFKAKVIWPTCHHMVELAGLHTSCSMYSLMWPFLGSKLDKHFYKLVCVHVCVLSPSVQQYNDKKENICHILELVFLYSMSFEDLSLLTLQQLVWTVLSGILLFS